MQKNVPYQIFKAKYFCLSSI